MLIEIKQRGSDTDVLRAYWLVATVGSVEFASKLLRLGIKNKEEYEKSPDYKEHLDQIKCDINWHKSYVRDEHSRVKRMLEDMDME